MQRQDEGLSVETGWAPISPHNEVYTLCTIFTLSYVTTMYCVMTNINMIIQKYIYFWLDLLTCVCLYYRVMYRVIREDDAKKVL